MPNVPNTNQPGLVLFSVGDGQNSSQWGGLSTLELPYTYSVQGTLGVPSGATNFLPPFFWPVPSGQAVTVVAVRAMVRAGSVTMSIQQNGITITGLSGISVTTTATTFTPTAPASISDGDYFAPVISAVSSADGLSLTFYCQVSA